MGKIMFLEAGIQFVNVSLIILGITGFVLFVIVLFKLNKALDIWMKQNEKK